MSSISKLRALFEVISAEASRNESFRAKLDQVLDHEANDVEFRQRQPTRRGGRRAPAALDPVETVSFGVESLRAKLAELHLDQLKDIVAQYGMDTNKLVMKWKDRDKIVDRIVEVASARARKGEAFRNE